jgi:hypothetical protein
VRSIFTDAVVLTSTLVDPTDHLPTTLLDAIQNNSRINMLNIGSCNRSGYHSCTVRRVSALWRCLVELSFLVIYVSSALWVGSRICGQLFVFVCL